MPLAITRAPSRAVAETLPKSLRGTAERREEEGTGEGDRLRIPRPLEEDEDALPAPDGGSGALCDDEAFSVKQYGYGSGIKKRPSVERLVSMVTRTKDLNGGAKPLQLITPQATGKATEHFKHQICSQQCSISSGVILWRHLH